MFTLKLCNSWEVNSEGCYCHIVLSIVEASIIIHEVFLYIPSALLLLADVALGLGIVLVKPLHDDVDDTVMPFIELLEADIDVLKVVVGVVKIELLVVEMLDTVVVET